MKICVPSLGRAGNSSTMSKLKEENLLDITVLFVYSDEIELYSKAYPGVEIYDCGTFRNLSRKRNAIIEYGLKNKLNHVFMLDDDISTVYFKDENQKVSKTNIETLINECLNVKEEYVICGPRYNFIYTDYISKDNKLIEYSVVAGALCINLNNIKNYRFDENMIIEDMDLFMQIILNGDKVYKLRNIQIVHKTGQKGGYQLYTTMLARHEKGIKQLHSKYIDSDKYIILSKKGVVGFNKSKYLKHKNEDKGNKI